MLTLETISPALLYHFKNEAELLKTIQELVYIFNFKRDDLKNYVLSDRQVSAYSLFYQLTNIPKWNYLKKQLPTKLQERIAHSTLIDWGTGPGTYLWAHLESGHQGKMYGVDQSKTMLKQAEKIASALNLFERVEFVHTNQYQKICGQENTTLLFSNSANEMPEDLILQVIKNINPEIIIFLEPGNLSSFQKLRTLTEPLKQKGFSIEYPCLGNTLCPLPENDWCHHSYEISLEPELEKMCQRLKIDRVKSNSIFHVYSRQVQKDNSFKACLVNKKPKQKWGFEWFLCQERNGVNTVSKMRCLKRYISKDQYDMLSAFNQGEYLQENELNLFKE